MKKTKYLGLCALAGLFSLCLVNVQAAQYHEPSAAEQIANDAFSNIKDSERVLEMPEGGFLYGKATEYSTSDLNTVVAEYDSKTDPKSVTVAEAKEILKEDAAKSETSIQPYGATPPSASTLRELAYGASYTSKIFYANGWRFGEIQWKAAPNTGGDYLKWTSLIDSGRVGSYGEAVATLSGYIQGQIINANSFVFNSEGDQGQIYYTQNPIAGTQYIVENVD